VDRFLEESFGASSTGIDLTVFMPCLNEQERVAGALEKVFAAAGRTGTRIEVLVFDDGSTDNTAQVVRSYQSANPQHDIRLISLVENRGIGRNFIDGAFLGKGAFYRTVAGDDYEFPDAHEQIMRSLGQADIILPIYRDVVGRTAFRRALSATYTRLVNVLSGTSVKYYNGFAAYRRWHVMRFAIEASGFGFQAELITRLIGEGATYKEIELPATAQPGSKALRLRNFVSVGRSLLRIAARRLSRKWR
jgi:glycosyltransferase involved in cell wall biosynthesis